MGIQKKLNALGDGARKKIYLIINCIIHSDTIGCRKMGGLLE